MDIVRLSLDLFRGCQLKMYMVRDTMNGGDGRVENPGEFLAYLSLLAPNRPFSIELWHYTNGPSGPGQEVDVLLRESTMLACLRLTLWAHYTGMQVLQDFLPSVFSQV